MSSRKTPSPAAWQAVGRAARWTATPAGLATLFAAGFVLRLLLARGGGFPSDIAVFQSWAARLAEVGPGGFYAPDVFADYPPGYLYVLWIFGEIAAVMFDGVVPVFLVKLPAIVADVGLAYVVMRLASIIAAQAGRPGRPGATDGRSERWWVRPAAAAAILFNPPIVFLSAVWGQVDTVAALYALGGVLLLVKPERTTRSEAGGAALLALAFATKPQTAFLLPVAAVVLLVRHLRDRKPDPAQVATRLGVPLASFFGVWLALALPFGLTFGELLRFYANAGSTYPYTSVWAFNLWGIAGFWRADSGPGAYQLFGADAVSVGIVVFCAAVSYVLVRAYRALTERRGDAEVLLGAGAVVVCLSFALLTRIHERYLFLGLACLAPLVVYPRVRAVFGALSALYMLNLWFPWVYYVREAGRTTLNVGWLFDLVYGTAQDSTQKKLLSLVTAVVCIFLAARIWQLATGARAAPGPERPAEEPRPRPRQWSVGLHPIGRKGAALAGAVFLVVVPTRLVGLSSPQEMYFDEIYHARTAGEYLEGRDAYEFTHPPLGKELMALSIATLGSWEAERGGDAPPGLVGGYVDSDGTGVAWAAPAPGGGEGVLWTATAAGECSLEAVGEGIPLTVRPTAVAVAPGGAFVGGESGNRSVVVRYSGGAPLWETRLPAPVAVLADAGEVAFAVDEDRTLWRVDPTGARAIAEGASSVAVDPAAASDPALAGVWAAFPDQSQVSAYDAGGTLVSSVTTETQVDDLVVVPEADRVVTFDADTGVVETIDSQSRAWERSLETSGEVMAASPQQGFVYAVDGVDVEVIEPRALARVGDAELPFEAQSFLPVTESGALMAVGDDGVACLSGNAFFAWRLPGALLGALVPALVFLLALRCTGRLGVAALAAAFVALDGLGFAMARIATLDSQATAHVVASWLGAASVYFHAQAVVASDRRGSRRLGLVWVAATGLFLGLAIATKWVGVYSFLLIAAVMVLDLFVRRERGVGALFPRFGVAVPAIVAAVVALPVAIYVLSYVPYMSLGNGLGDVARLQKGMYDYHNNLTAGHPYASSWYGWPFGHKAVALWTGMSGAETGAITAIANPVVLVGGLWALALAAVTAWRNRVAALALLPAAALVQYLPWAIVDRAAFLYHYLPVVPFLAIGLAWAVVGREGESRLRKYEAGFVLAAAAAVFALTLPELDGWYVSQWFHDSLHDRWLPWLF
ncbi:MAG TPA: phospholipid carrier-dependent glycosyltransferase [Actinomycetota bacterium]|nr:phospholipid carrier-dependent glycosyltransferase [Actinomycetota bacterium]